MGFTKRKRAKAGRLFHPVDIKFKTHVGRKLDMAKNSLKRIRESLLMSKSELAREANVSPITITRIEEGKPCRMETKRKILLALGYSLSDAKKIFNE
jgi:DNA-binding XRE family transcriptional regulator